MNTTKRICLILTILLCTCLTGCGKDEKTNIEKVQSAYNGIILPETTNTNLNLTTKYGEVNAAWSSSNEELITSSGIVTLPNENTEVTLTVVLTLGNVVKTKTFKVVVLADNSDARKREYVESKIKELVMPTETSVDLTLVKQLGDINVNWISKTPLIIWHTGTIKRSNIDQVGTLSATFTYSTISITKDYEIKVLKYSVDELLNESIEKFEIPEQIYFDISDFMYPEILPGVEITWATSNENIIAIDGKVNRPSNTTVVILTLTLKVGEKTMSKDFEVEVLKEDSETKPHQTITHASEFDEKSFNNVVLENDKLVLASGTLEGSYESGEVPSMPFKSLVASWAAVSTTTATIELFVKAMVNGVWSDYITYHPWGFGLENKCYDQQNSLIKLSDDEVMVLNNKYGEKVQFKVVLRRTSVEVSSPRLSLVSFAYYNTGYSYDVDITNLPKEVIYQVPRLYQGAVPTIGNSICSPTTSTMLLKYMGEDFSSYDTYEHRYIAYKFKEYNSGIFGNWVYNTVGMSSFGYDAYVARMYSVEELVKHLATVGPCGLSVKGQMTSTEKNYYTNGHLIVAIGYKYINNVLYIVCNDPNVPNVYCEYSVSVINNTWRNIAYVIEKKA